MSRTRGQRYAAWTVFFLLILALILVPYFAFGTEIEQWTQHYVRESPGGRFWAGLILGGALASDILLPIPSSLASTACGNLLGFVLGAVTSLAGMTISCVAGYWLGARGGTPLAERLVGEGDLARLAGWTRRFGDWTVVVSRPVPVLAEAAVLVVGIGHMPFRRFLLLSTLANTGISLVYAAIGAYAARTNAFLLAFFFAVLLPGLAMFFSRPRRRPRSDLAGPSPDE